MAQSFDDSGKSVKDLLTKGFPANGTFLVSTDTKSSTGLSFKTEFVKKEERKKNEKNPNEFTFEEKVQGTFEPKFDWKEQNVEFSGKFGTCKNGPYEAGLTVKDLGTAGTKFTFTGVQDKDGCATKASGSFKNQHVNGSLGLTYPFDDAKAPAANGSLLVQHNEFFAGTSGTYELPATKDGDAKVSVNGVAGYTTSKNQLHAFVQNNAKVQVVGFGWFHQLTDAVKFALNGSVERKNTRGPEAVFGGEYKVDGSTTLKGKFTVQQGKDSSDVTEFRAGVAGAQKVNSNITTTLGADLNVKQLLGGNEGAPHSFGFEVKFSN